MTPCPSDKSLALLLDDAMGSFERDALVEHVEQCTACQEKLARLSEAADAELGKSSKPVPPSSQAEEEIVRRLKTLPRSSMPSLSHRMDTTIGLFAQRELATQSVIDTEWPTVPGYEIIGVLGRGGVGVVYKAKHTALPRIVALKMLGDWARAGEKELARFRSEAELIARLKHPNIVQIYDIGDVGGRPYFVLEYVAGGSLAQHLDGTPQSPRLAAQFVEVLARAVHAAHADGVVHRDLKPANILLISPQHDATSAVEARGPNGLAANGGPMKAIPKIADFGMAKCAVGDEAAALQRSLTATGDLLGTPSYMAPEQATPGGQPIGPAADIYALGAILYELLTGRPPFKGETPLDTVLQVLHNELVAVTELQPNCPRDLETICLKCLRKEPRFRYQTASELADDLQSFLQGDQIQARPQGAAEKVWRWIRQHPATSGLLAAGLLSPVIALATLSLLSAKLVRSSALESAAQQAELLDHANNQYSLIVQRVQQANYPVNKMVPPTPDTVPLSVPATFLHDVGQELHENSKTGIQVRQYSDYPFPWRTPGGPQDDFERYALRHFRETNGQDAVHDFTEIDGEPVVRYAQARIMQQSCVDCHNTHPLSSRRDWKVGDVRGVLEIIRPLKNDEARVTQALQLTLLVSAAGSVLLLLASVLAVWSKQRRIGART